MREPGVESVEALRHLASVRRVYYEVVPDLVFQGDRFEQVGFVLTLWASHERGARALPGCAACRAIFDDLQLLANWAVDGEGGPDASWEVDPFDAALHSPHWDLADDEIDLALHLVQRESAGAAGEAARDGSLRHVLERLKGLGIREGIWHPASGAAHEHR